MKYGTAGLIIACILLSLPAVASETGTVVAYNVKQQNLLQTPPCPAALGDGSTDDTSAIQCALTAAGNAGGGIVFLPQGSYRTSASLTVPSSVILEGAGAGTTIKPLNGATIGQGIVMLSNSTTAVSFATIRDLHIDGNGTNIGGVVAGVALDYGANHNTISNLVVENARAEGIGLYVSNTSLTNDYNFISGNTVHDNGVGAGGCGQLIVWTGRYNQIVDNRIYKGGALRSSGGWGILFNVTGTALTVQHNIVRGNTISNSGYAGIWLNDGLCSGCTTQIAWNEISGNITKDNQNYGILTQITAGHQTITGNTATGNGLDGIIIQTSGNTISNNVLNDNGRNGIFLEASAFDNVVVGNVAQNVATTSQQRGIYEIAGTADFNLITGNNGRNNVLKPGIVKTGANTIMVNNQGQ